jgi:hypothetical protein
MYIPENAPPLDSELIAAGVDYMTVTTKANSPELDFLIPWFKREIASAAEREGEVRDLSPQGYKGHMTEHLFAGVGKEGFMFRASSDIADDLAHSVIQAGVPVHLTRLDVCVDSKGSERDDTFVARSRFYIRHEEAMRGGGRSVRLDLVEGARGGDSITVGSRKARRYFRIYNKHLQSKGQYPVGTLRWELECKREFARSMWERATVEKNLQKLAIDSVCRYATEKGLNPSWRHAAEPRRLPVSHRAAAPNKKQQWLLEQVAEWVKDIDDEVFKAKFLDRCGYRDVTPKRRSKTDLNVPHDFEARRMSPQVLQQKLADWAEVQRELDEAAAKRNSSKIIVSKL